MSYDPTLFNIDPYYDDFKETKKFLRVMFKPGYAVQAREVTQLQTILQNQIDRFGKHVFENGSLVLDGQVTENYLRFGRITGLTGFANPKDIIGTIVSGTNTARAKIIHAEGGLSSSTLDPHSVVFFEYLEGGTTFGANTVLSGTAGNAPISFSLTGLAGSGGNVIGDATVISVDSGVRFVDGYFVMHDAQMLAASTITGAAGAKYRVFGNPTTRIGFQVSKSFVTADDDDSLNDPAFGYYNYAAPGADRFKIDLGLTQCEFIPTDISTTTNFARSDFLEIIRIVNGETIKKEMYPDYAVIEDTLARRTFDESGNYTVEPFDLNITYRNVTPDITGATLSAELSPGKAYVFGYEFETQGTNVLTLPRARATKSYTNQAAIGSVGPSLTVSMGGSAASLTGFNLSEQPIVHFDGRAVGATFNSIGTARVRGLFPSGSNYSLYLYDIAMSGSNTLANATRIFLGANAINGGATGQQAFNIVWGGQTGTLSNVNDTGMLFLLPKGDRISTVSGVDYATSNMVRATVAANGNIPTISLPSNTKLFSVRSLSMPIQTSSPDLFVLSVTGAAVGFTASVPSVGGTLSITANAANQNVYVFYTTDMGTVGGGYLRRTKTLVTETLSSATGAFQVDPQTGRTFLYVGLGATAYADVVSVSSITGTLNGTSNTQLLNYFTFDNGQRDDYYDWSRLILASNAIPSSTNPGGSNVGITGGFSMTIKRFEHGSERDGPFTKDSYNSEYRDIPIFTSPTTGKSYRLSDVLDFRPVKAPNGSLTGHVVVAPTTANDNKFNYSQYLPRTDKIALTKDRNFKVISGIPSVDATPPVDDPEAMTLYNITLNGFTVDKDDVQVQKIENRRYTMQDIAQIEDRLDAVEYFTNLSLLEQQAKSSPLLDSNGIEIPKKGILVDGFRGHSVSDVQDPMYSASIDYENGEMRPAFRNRVYRMNSVASPSNVTGSSDGIYTLAYTTTPLINQPLATTSLNVNPSGVFNYLGFARTTPSSDFWYDDTRAPTVRVNTDGENDAWIFGSPLGTGPGEAKGFGTQWRDWESNWSGISRTNSYVSDNFNSSRSVFVTSSGTRTIPSTSSSSIVPNSLVNTIGDLQVRNDLLPYARNIQVNVKARSLRPNTTFYLFVDGISVSVSPSIVSDASGFVNFNFTIPASTFGTGRKNIRLTDSSTNNLSATTSAADCVLSIQGTWGNNKDGIVTTRTVQSRRESVRSERIVTNVFGKTVQRSGFVKLVGYTDPLSQSFFVDPAIYPSGIFTKKITLYFKSKDNDNNMPLTLTLRPIINGFPHPSKYIPLSDVSLASNSVQTTTNASIGTDFEFSSPIYLAPGEYAFSLTTPSNNFEIYTSQVGSNVIKQTTSEATVRATKQPYARSLYKNQTSSGVQKSETEDIKFLLHLCNFSPLSGSVNVRNEGSTYYDSGSIAVDAVRYNIPSILPSDTVLSASENGSLAIGALDINKTLELPNTKTVSNPNTNFTNLALNLSTTDPFVSPVFDTDRASVYCIQNRINRPSVGDFNGETGSTNLGVPSNERCISRYISKRVVLEPNVIATTLRVETLASKPEETNFKIYARMSPENGTGLPFDLRGYVEMIPARTYSSTQVGQFQEMSYSLTGQSGFRVFAVKIVMTSTDSAIVPVFKNVRITAA